jgi:hypothetical protein
MYFRRSCAFFCTVQTWNFLASHPPRSQRTDTYPPNTGGDAIVHAHAQVI